MERHRLGRWAHGSSPLGRAPALALIVGFSVFLAATGEMGAPFAASAGMSLAAAFGWFALGTEYPPKGSLPVACVLFIAAVAGIFSINSSVAAPGGDALDMRGWSGVALADRKWGYMRAALVRVIDPNSPWKPAKVVLKYRGGAALEPGDAILVSGRAREFKRSNGPREFDERLYWRAKGAVGEVVSPVVSVTGKKRGFALWRKVLSRRIRMALPARTAGYILASWTGERDEGLADFHREAGTSHLLAVSGLHVGVVWAIAQFLLRRVRFRLFFASAVIWSYALLSGASPSSMRAALMIQFVILGKILGHSGSAFNSASLAASAMLIFNPWLFWDVGWRMSVLSVLALSSLAALEAENSAKALAASPVVWLATSMQSAWTFESVPFAGIVINIFAPAVFAVLLPLASVMSLPSLLGLNVGFYPAALAELAFAAWERFSGNLTFLFPWSVSFSIPLLLGGVAVLVWLFAKACGFSRHRAWTALAANMACLCCFLWNA